MAEHRSSIDVGAAPDTVYRFLVTEQGLTTWMSQWASLNPVPGGRFEVNIAGHPVRGSFLEVVHTDLPKTEVAGHADGWSQFLPRLRQAA
jgi:uncharacterized protein YndB with AHSA1/START domain